jgi:hypothetical protein
LSRLDIIVTNTVPFALYFLTSPESAARQPKVDAMRATATILFSLLACCLAVQIGSTGCSSRVETAVAESDSTLTYPSRSPDGPRATITFCRKISKKTGKLIGEGRVFTAGDKVKVRAIVELENAVSHAGRDLMFHLVWIGPNQKEFFTKRIDHAVNDSSGPLKSTISIHPDKRPPGLYRLRVYLFRELIAEKTFELRAATD